MLCSLGFEQLSSAQMIRTLSCIDVIPDSDVVISLLCEGEENHSDVERILMGWKAIGGRIIMIRPVLEEIAYHAWISEYEYSFFGSSLADIPDSEAERVIGNAFARGFRKVSQKATDRTTWNYYIGQFKGISQLDHTKIQDHLKNDYGFTPVPDPSNLDPVLQRRINQFLVKRLCAQLKCEASQLDRKHNEKASRDSRLICAVLASRVAGQASGEAKTFCIVSSARLIRDIDQSFRRELGEPNMVLSLAAMSFLLTLTPGVPMGMSTLRSVLFDTYLATRLTPLQRFAYKVITASGQWSLPWSRRGTLQRELSRSSSNGQV